MAFWFARWLWTVKQLGSCTAHQILGGASQSCLGEFKSRCLIVGLTSLVNCHRCPMQGALPIWSVFCKVNVVYCEIYVSSLYNIWGYVDTIVGLNSL